MNWIAIYLIGFFLEAIYQGLSSWQGEEGPWGWVQGMVAAVLWPITVYAHFRQIS